MEINTNAKWPKGAGLKRWPFKNMDVNQTISFKADIKEWRTIQQRAHSYGNLNQIAFRTHYDNEQCIGYVQRIV